MGILVGVAVAVVGGLLYLTAAFAVMLYVEEPLIFALAIFAILAVFAVSTVVLMHMEWQRHKDREAERRARDAEYKELCEAWMDGQISDDKLMTRLKLQRTRR